MDKYEKNIIGIISDVRFPKKNKLTKNAGISLLNGY